MDAGMESRHEPGRQPSTAAPRGVDARADVTGSAATYKALHAGAVRNAAQPTNPVHGTQPAQPHNVAGVGSDVPPAGAGAARLRWAAEQLEALLVHELLKSMRRTVVKTGMFDGPGVKMFEEMLDEERAGHMAAAGGLGLAQLIYEQMSRHVPDAEDSRTTRPAAENKSNGAT